MIEEHRYYITTPEMFGEVLADRVETIREVLADKAREYAPDEDRLRNFRAGASMNRTTPEGYLYNLMAKHLIALRDYIDLLKQGKVVPHPWWREKIGDSINYLILLEALVLERTRPKGNAIDEIPDRPEPPGPSNNELIQDALDTGELK